jgi:hypothetical protein
MKYPRPFVRYVMSLVKYLQSEFYLREWDIDVRFMPSPKDKNGDVAAAIKTDHTYFNATVYVYPRLLEWWKDPASRGTVKEAIVHEFCHILTDPLYKIAIDAVSNSGAEFLETIREQQTQHISNIIKDYIPNKIKPAHLGK